jgi:hypothetical protein
VRGRQLALLLRNEFLSQSRPVLVTAAAAFALLAVSWIVNVAVGQVGDFYPFFFGATMVVGGVVLASRAFATVTAFFYVFSLTAWLAALHNIGSTLVAVLRTHGPALSIAASIMARGVLPVFFLGLACLRLTEHEVQDGL